MSDFADATDNAAALNKAKVLIEALPYIQKFSGTTVVIKYGGHAMVDGRLQDAVMEDIALMKLVGMRPVVVHGGGPEINQTLDRLGIQSEFVRGDRVTDAQTMEVVEMVLTGKVNQRLVSRLQQQGIPAVGISGRDGGTLLTEPRHIEGRHMGFLGQVTAVDTTLMESLIASGFVPVISPVGVDAQGNAINLNADLAAAAIAAALKAYKLMFLTDVPGLLDDVTDPTSRVSTLTTRDAQARLADGRISGGMIPKVECCLEAMAAGVTSVHILDGRVEHAMLLECFTAQGIGTMFLPETAPQDVSVGQISFPQVGDFQTTEPLNPLNPLQHEWARFA